MQKPACVTRSLQQLNTQTPIHPTLCASPLSSPIAYSIDGRYLFQREAHVIHIRHPRTGHILHQCLRNNDTSNTSKSYPLATVMCITLHPFNALQLFASYSDNHVILWDFTEEKQLKSFQFAHPILWMNVSTQQPWMMHMVIALKASFSFVYYDLQHTRKLQTFSEISGPITAIALHTVNNTQHNEMVDFVAIACSQQVEILCLHPIKTDAAVDTLSKLPETTALQRYIFTHRNDVTCVAWNPKDNVVELALGDDSGQIHLFHLQADQAARRLSNASFRVHTKLHWHSQSLRCLQYSLDGQFLVSGGEECVLVFWHLATGRRSYLPRRSASILAITARRDSKAKDTTRPSTLGYGILLDDHVLFQYNSVTREEEWYVSGFARSGTSAKLTLPNFKVLENCKGLSPVMVYDPITKTLPLNGQSSVAMVQFYDPLQDRVVQNLPLSERNPVTRTEPGDPVIVTTAQKWLFSPCGQYFITLQAETVSHSGKETRKIPQNHTLRWWKRREDGSFFLHTAVDAPHGKSRITSMVYSPDTRYLHRNWMVTGDENGEFRVWKLSASSSAKNVSLWQCHAVVRHRPFPITSMQFSSDGSLLAVAYGKLLTVWKMETTSLGAVVASADGNAIVEMYFADIATPFLVVKTVRQVQVWNLLTLSLAWEHAFSSEKSWVCLHPFRSVLTLCTPTDLKTDCEFSVLEIEIENGKAVREIRFKLPENNSIWAVGFAPNCKDETVALVIMDNVSNMWMLSLSDTLPAKNRKGTETVESTDPRGKLAGILPMESKKHENQSSKVSMATNEATRCSVDLFDAPSHVLPPISSMYRTFMDGFIFKKKQLSEAKVETAQSHSDTIKPFSSEIEPFQSNLKRWTNGLRKDMLTDTVSSHVKRSKTQ
uniref:Uncharacterized protein AlNc14C40G3432 n=1 Tax=Albugo laibachii Nc14 TaxID=890382 RepID=F0W9H3_9STRA|nr:conserved hypothetical protein [Albugo laibachii Nc14]|eukprot:CCA17787.1 conserved hypothetical protein [Albugo laibachii Nc14]